MSTKPIAFGTEGWRAIVADDFTYDSIRAVAQGVADYLSSDQRAVVVGHDTRYCAEQFAAEVTGVLAANGYRVLLLDGPHPTPAVSWTVIQKAAAGAVVVTASHNPPEFNGLKFKPDNGGTAPPEVIEKIESLSLKVQTGQREIAIMAFDEAKAQGMVQVVDGFADYQKQIARMVDLESIRNAGLRIVHEAMYGAGSGYIRRILAGSKTQITELHCERNASFGGMHPEPIDKYMPEALALMSKGEYDLCIANDGDADRVGIIDDSGKFVNQLQVSALLAMYLLEKKQQRGPLVRSLTSTNMLDKLGQKFGVEVYETPVGFKYVSPKMIATGAILGAEESGGFAFAGHIPERDGILAGLLIAEMVVKYGQPLSKLLQKLEEMVGPHSYARRDIRLPREGYAEHKAEAYAHLQRSPLKEGGGRSVIRINDEDGFKYYFDDGAWVLTRFSGTEPLIRIYSEAPDATEVETLLDALQEHMKLETRIA